ncbi:MAG: hypothetical protein RL030_1742 [Pseudomonadota bacterium]|jgi:hypothetical protein
MDKVAETCLWSLIATAGDCEEEGKPDRAAVLTLAAKHLKSIIEDADREIGRRFGIGGELIVARRDRDEALHKLRVAERVLERLVRRCEVEMADTIDVPEIQTAKALLGLGA